MASWLRNWDRERHGHLPSEPCSRPSPSYRPRGNQAAIKRPLGETISSSSMALVTSPLFEAVYSKYFLSYLMGDAKEEIGLNLLANSLLSVGQTAARSQEISVFSQLVIK